MKNENKKEYESNNDNTEARFYDKPNYNEKITLSRLIPIESKGHRLIIGKGAFSNVYLYKDIISQEKYAVKIMEKDFILKNLETLEIINKEIEIQSRINHPNIIRLYNIYENSNNQSDSQIDEQISNLSHGTIQEENKFETIRKRLDNAPKRQINLNEE